MKKLAKEVSEPLAKIIAWRQIIGKLPEDWKRADRVPILKKREKKERFID